MPTTLVMSPAIFMPPPPSPGVALDPDLFALFPGPAALISSGRPVAGNTDGLALAACLTDPLPVPPAQVRVLVGARQFDLTLLPAIGGVLLLARDATLERNLIEALARSRQLFRDLVQCSSEFAWETTPDGRFGFVSPRGALGFAAAELAGRPSQEIAADAEGPWPFADSEPHDVTEARERAMQLADAHSTAMRLSRTDDLTDLLNRRAFVTELDVRLANARRHGHGGTLLYIDLDHFKAVNDVLGHGAGDACLKALAAEIKSCGRVGDLGARLGGDEFAIWLEHTGRQGGVRKAEKLLAGCVALRETYGAADRPLGLSIGIAISRAGDTAASLITRADEAMYEAKHGGKNRHALAG